MTKRKNLLQFEQVKANKIEAWEYAVFLLLHSSLMLSLRLCCDPHWPLKHPEHLCRAQAESEILYTYLCVFQRGDNSMQHVTDNH